MRRLLPLVPVPLLLALLSACQVPDGARSEMAGPVVRPAVETVRYDSEPWGKIDILRSTGSASRGVIVWVHGGAWLTGSRDFSGIPHYVAAMLERGWSIASIDYPNALERSPEEMLQSVQNAVTYVRENGTALGVDTGTIVLGGHSAGGWLAARAGYGPGLADGIDAVIAFAAPLDLLALSRNTRPLYGYTLASLTNVLLDCAPLNPLSRDACGRERLTKWSVTDILRSDGPSVYLGYGDVDDVVTVGQARAAARRFEKTLGYHRVWVDIAEGSGHAVEGVNVRSLSLFLELVTERSL